MELHKLNINNLKAMANITGFNLSVSDKKNDMVAKLTDHLVLIIDSW